MVAAVSRPRSVAKPLLMMAIMATSALIPTTSGFGASYSWDCHLSPQAQTSPLSASQHAVQYNLPNGRGTSHIATFVSPDTPAGMTHSLCHESLRYPPNTECVFNYEAAAGSYVYFKFNSFRLDLDAFGDYVRIETVGAPPNARYSETFDSRSVPTALLPGGEIIPWRRVRLTFDSDDYYSCRGFTALFRGFLPPPTCPPPNTGRNGWIGSPGDLGQELWRKKSRAGVNGRMANHDISWLRRWFCPARPFPTGRKGEAGRPGQLGDTGTQGPQRQAGDQGDEGVPGSPTSNPCSKKDLLQIFRRKYGKVVAEVSRILDKHEYQDACQVSTLACAKVDCTVTCNRRQHYSQTVEGSCGSPGLLDRSPPGHAGAPGPPGRGRRDLLLHLAKGDYCLMDTDLSRQKRAGEQGSVESSELPIECRCRGCEE